MQSLPVCMVCREQIPLDEVVFQAACGHDRCASSAFHPLCLMEWRDEVERTRNAVRESGRKVLEEHEAMLLTFIQTFIERGEWTER